MPLPAGGGRVDDALSRLEQLRERHLAAARALAPNEANGPLGGQITAQFDDLTALVRALGVLREVSAAYARRRRRRRRASQLAHCRRRIERARHSVGMGAMRARDHHQQRPYARGPLADETDAALRSSVLPVIEAGRVPVLGGFVGSTIGGHTTTLGRGGSDYSGAIVGAGIGAREIQIWTDVDGMLTADPRVIAHRASFRSSRSRRRPNWHTSARKCSIRARFFRRSSEHSRPHPQLEEGGRRGTTITAEPPPGSTPLTALACKRDVTVVDITSSRMLMAYGFLRRVFEVFERYTTAVDVVTTSKSPSR